MSRWAQVRQVFEAALLLPQSEQRAFLDRDCADAGIRAEVLSMLDADGRASRFLETPVRSPDSSSGISGQATGLMLPGLSTALETALETGQAVGRYEVLGLLGEGGMGRVYRARRSDGHFDQEVAVKIIRDGLGGDALVACFLRERQILADLDHPGIARLLDGGATADGRPYLVMEYIEGEPLLTYCRRCVPELESRLKLFLQICEAVQYAHRQLVMHRDLKPDNVLVDAQGRPRLLDFGTAKLLGDAQLETSEHADASATARHWCSPGYASPEQMSGESVSTATDLYALGAVLYALLTDRGPHRFTSRNPMAMARVVIEETVELPSRLVSEADDPAVARRARNLRGDLDTIVLTAMAKKPERRYPSVDALADDIRRHLAHRPIRARRPTLGYRADRFLRRHWRGASLLLLLLTAVLFGALAYVLQSRETAYERDRAEAQGQRAQQVASLLAEMFEDFDPDESPGQRQEIRRRLDRNARRIEAVASDPEVRAALLHTLGVSYGKLGFFAEADHALSEAIRLRRYELGFEHLDTASSLRELGTLVSQDGQWARGSRLRAWAADIRRQLLPEDAPELAESWLDLADAAVRGDDPKLAVTLAERAVSILEGRLPEGHIDLVHAQYELGSCLLIAGEIERSEALLAQVLEAQIEQLGPEHSDVAQTRREMAIVALRRGDAPEARRRLEATRTAFDRILGEDHPRSVDAAQELAIIYLNLGMCVDARELVERSLQMAKRLFADPHPNVGLIVQYLGIVKFHCGPRAEALEPLIDAVKIFEDTVGPEHFRTGSALYHLARMQRWQKDFTGAEASMNRVRDIRLAFYGAQHSAHAETLREMGLLAGDLGELDKAEGLLRRAFELRLEVSGDRHPDTLNSELDLANLSYLQGDPLGAKARVEEIQERIIAHHGKTQIYLLDAARILARIEAELSDKGG